MITWSHRYIAAIALSLAVRTASAAQSGRTLHTVLDLRIDADKANLTRIGVMFTSPAGEILVTQGEESTVRYFSATGVPGSFGRPGEGPGEFRRNWRGGFKQDSIWVLDPATERVSIFDARHKYVRAVPSPTKLLLSNGGDAGPSELYVQAMLADGALRAIATPRGNTRPEWARDVDSGGTQFVRVGGDGRLLNRIAVLPRTPCQVGYSFAKGTGTLLKPFCSEPLTTGWDASPDLAIAWMDGGSAVARKYAVSLINSDGSVAFVRQFGYTPIPISRHVIDSTRNAYEARRQQQPPSIRNAMPAVSVPTVYPAVRRIVEGRDRSVWIEEWWAGDAHRWRVLASDGTDVGTLTLPADVTLMAADRQHVWGTQTDEDGLLAVVRYAIAP